MINRDNRSKLTVVDLSDNTSVTDGGGTNTQTLTPPAGKIYIIRDIYYSCAAPVGDTSGTHKIRALCTYVSTARVLIVVKGNHSTSLTITAGTMIGDSDETPADGRDQHELIKSGFIHASNTYPIAFEYTNNTDAAQTGTRTLEILVEEINEMS
jgi:hypothetical protein